MTTIRQLPRASSEALDAITGPVGHIRIDLTRNELRLYTGVIPGGVRIPSMDQLRALFLLKEEGLGEEVGIPVAGVGLLVRVDANVFAFRQLVAGDGVAITNPGGVSADPELSIEESWFVGQFTQRTATPVEIRAGAPEKLITANGLFDANTYFTLTDAAEIVVNFSDGWNFYVELQGNRTLGAPSNVKAQAGFITALAVDAPRTLSANAVFLDPLDLLPVTIPTSQRAYISYFVNEVNRPIISNVLVFGA